MSDFLMADFPITAVVSKLAEKSKNCGHLKAFRQFSIFNTILW
jgi:hypothetical protein